MSPRPRTLAFQMHGALFNSGNFGLHVGLSSMMIERKLLDARELLGLLLVLGALCLQRLLLHPVVRVIGLAQVCFGVVELVFALSLLLLHPQLLLILLT